MTTHKERAEAMVDPRVKDAFEIGKIISIYVANGDTNRPFIKMMFDEYKRLTQELIEEWGESVEGIPDLADFIAKETTANHVIMFKYTNYRGETDIRTVIPGRVYWGTTKWHPEPGFLFEALDFKKQEVRQFALADCDFTYRLSEGVDPS